MMSIAILSGIQYRDVNKILIYNPTAAGMAHNKTMLVRLG